MTYHQCVCDNCKLNGSWRQQFGNEVVRLCEKHHRIIRNKVPNRFKLDEDVLYWLKKQSTNPHKVVKYSVYSIYHRTYRQGDINVL